MELQFDDEFMERLKKIDKSYFLKKMIDQAGVIAVNFSKQRFVDKNWRDTSTEPWKPRKRTDRGSTLVRSGRLKRSIRKLVSGNYFVYIGTDVPYAQIHNEGGEINKSVSVKSHSRTRSGRPTTRVKGHTRNMKLKIPKRQFLGDSEYLAKGLEMMMQRAVEDEIAP
jgi:phage gpG-like protein